MKWWHIAGAAAHAKNGCVYPRRTRINCGKRAGERVRHVVVQVAANWAFKTFGECVHDWRKLVRAKATERVGDVGNFDTHGFALFAEGTNFLGAAVGDLHQVDGNLFAFGICTILRFICFITR